VVPQADAPPRRRAQPSSTTEERPVAEAARRRIEADFEVHRNAALLGEVFARAQRPEAERARAAG
jgi:hypothetical protein